MAETRLHRFNAHGMSDGYSTCLDRKHTAFYSYVTERTTSGVKTKHKFVGKIRRGGVLNFHFGKNVRP